jgi:cell fate regulator YaaT (PSP1 superfamily)
MPEVVGVTFRDAGKLRVFLCGDLDVAVGDVVVAETKRGIELGRVSKGRHWVNDKHGEGAPRKILRLATERDLEKHTANAQQALEALQICARKIEEHGLPMRLIDAEYTLDRSRITFYFTAETRVDFRRLLRDLYACFKTRIQLLQVGVRDEAKILGGIGPCGRPLCCCSFLRSFDPVAIKMAKTQGLSLNPSKISGVCGRLMCCLRYENEWYDAARATLPRVGCYVRVEQGTGKVTDVNVLKRTVTVQVEGSAPTEVAASTVTVVAPPGAPPRAQEQPAPEAAIQARGPSAPQEAPSPPQPPAAREERAAPSHPDRRGWRRYGRAPARQSGTVGRPGEAARTHSAPPAPPQGARQTGSDAASRPRSRRRGRPRRSRGRGPRTEFRAKRKDGDDGRPKTP